MKLYHSPQTRSVRPLWVLEEAGAPYELVSLDLSRGDHKAAEYMKIHPHGAVPALVDGDVKLIESAAICMHIADKFPEARLAPPVGSPERALYYQWIAYSIATLEPPILQVFMNKVQLPEEQRSAASLAEGKQKFSVVARVLIDALRDKPYLLGEQFTVADVMIGSTLAWAQFLGILAEYPELQAYVRRLAERPAFTVAHSK